MSLLLFVGRRAALKSQINDQNYRLTQKQQELQDLQQYTAAIADGTVSMNDLTTAPATMFGRMNQYMVNSHNFAVNAASQNMAYLQGTQQMQGTTTDTAQQAQYQNLVFKNLYDQQIAQFRKSEEAQMHVKEKALDNEILKINTLLKQLESEYEALGSQIDNAVKQSAPEYLA